MRRDPARTTRIKKTSGVCLGGGWGVVGNIDIGTPGVQQYMIPRLVFLFFFSLFLFYFFLLLILM